MLGASGRWIAPYRRLWNGIWYPSQAPNHRRPNLAEPNAGLVIVTRLHTIVALIRSLASPATPDGSVVSATTVARQSFRATTTTARPTPCEEQSATLGSSSREPHPGSARR